MPYTFEIIENEKPQGTLGYRSMEIIGSKKDIMILRFDDRDIRNAAYRNINGDKSKSTAAKAFAWRYEITIIK